MVYLTKVTEQYYTDTREEADALVEAAKHDSMFMLDSNKTAYKQVKSKGELLYDFYLTEIVKVFTDSKEPSDQYEVSYSRAGAF